MYVCIYLWNTAVLICLSVAFALQQQNRVVMLDRGDRHSSWPAGKALKIYYLAFYKKVS